MPLTLEIIRDGKALHFRCTEPWTVDEVLSTADQALQVYNQATHRIPALLDLRQMRRVPKDILRTRHAPTLLHPKSDGFVVLGGPGFVRRLSNTLHTMLNREFAIFVDSEEEAWAKLDALIEAVKT
jgi:hypothetical protein